MNFPTEQCLDEAVFLREFYSIGHIGPDPGEALEIAVDEALRLGARNPQVAGKTEAGDAVDDAEVDRLGLAADVAGHLVQGDVEHLGGGEGVDVDPVLEGAAQFGDVGDMGKDAQFDLGIVEADEEAAFRGHESLTDAAAFLGADGDVLQVRVGRGEAPGVGPGDRVGGVDAARIGVDRLLQGVGVGRFELGDLAPVEDPRRQFRPLRVAVFQRGDVFQDVGAGAIGPGLALLAAGNLQAVEEDLAQLLGGAHVELLARDGLDFLLQLHELLREDIGHAA